MCPRELDHYTKEKVKEELKGRGGLHHKYLQNLVKRLAQERGFHTTIEKPVLDNLGLVDVSLKGFDKNIAVEISVHTKDKWEASNISKCLSANYDMVVLLSDDAHHLDKLEQNLTKEFKIEIKNNRLKFLNPERLIAFLDDIRAKSSSKEETIAGYKVKVNYIPSTKTEQKIRDESIARVLLNYKNNA
jgi:hypothetical protein